MVFKRVVLKNVPSLYAGLKGFCSRVNQYSYQPQKPPRIYECWNFNLFNSISSFSFKKNYYAQIKLLSVHTSKTSHKSHVTSTVSCIINSRKIIHLLLLPKLKWTDENKNWEFSFYICSYNNQLKISKALQYTTDC